MKKILLATTGLVGAALIASAASAEAPKVTLGGVSGFQAGYTSDDKDASSNALGFRNLNTVNVKVDGKTDAGLGYGAEIDLEADVTDSPIGNGTNASRTFTYLEGAWGRTEMGSNKSVAATMRQDASSIAAASGGINGVWAFFPADITFDSAGFITGSKLVTENGSTGQTADWSSYKDTKVSYYTPVYSGFQAGVSFTPNSADKGQTMGRSDTTGFSNVWDLAASYNTQIDNSTKVGVAATYEAAESNVAGTQDIAAWNLGATAGYMGFTAAGSYGSWGDSARTSSDLDSSYWTAGLGYGAGPVAVSATYIDSTREESATADNEFTNLVLGADYKLAPGLTPYAEVSFYEFDGQGAETYDNQGSAVILGTQVAF